MRILFLLLAVSGFLWVNWRFRAAIAELKGPPAVPVEWSESLVKAVAEISKKYPDHLVSAADALKIHQSEDGGVFIDVRSPEEQAVSHIPGAILARPDGLDVEQEPWKSLRGAPILVYCTIGERSGEFKNQMRAKGWHAFNIQGGLCAWSFASGPLVDPHNTPTQQIHVYNASLKNSVSSDYVPVW